MMNIGKLFKELFIIMLNHGYPKNNFDRRLQIAKIVGTTTKFKERREANRKKLIDLPMFVSAVSAWQEQRPPLLEADTNFDLLKILSNSEIEEVDEHRQIEGMPGYNFKSEKGELIDFGFFLASFNRLAEANGFEVDYGKALYSANGQAKGSKSIDYIREATGNISEQSLEQDLEYLWTSWTSYLINMKFPVNPNKVLSEYTFPKNNGNYVLELLNGNKIFEMEYRRKMNPDEKIAYFSHYRKAMRLIRDFVIKYIDPMVEHNGLSPNHYRPYRIFIYSFMRFSSVGLNPEMALNTLEDQLYKDFDIKREGQPKILRLNTILPN